LRSRIDCRTPCARISRAAISRDLRRVRELAFTGAENLTPSAFYSEDDVVCARDGARLVVSRVGPLVLGS
jgi:hypothetical protein